MKEELKTLKDIFIKKDGIVEAVYEMKLRAEAVNDVKYYNALQGEGDYSDEQIEAIIEYIMKKNNLTEEDLK